MTEFRVGDVVRLKCGGPSMTLCEAWPDEKSPKSFAAAWHLTTGELRFQYGLVPAVLELVKAPEPGGPRELYAQIRDLCVEVRGLGVGTAETMARAQVPAVILEMLKEHGL